MKKGKQVVKTPPPFQSEREEEQDIFESKMRKNEPKVPKEREYFTYETLNDDSQEIWDSMKKEGKTNLQSVESEKERMPELTMSEEEIYKGIIYSEILKRKFN